MLIDWFTVVAQVLNFLILVWLMKRVLYKPILAAIDAREVRIAAAIADAEAQKVEATKERDTFQQKNETFDQARASLLVKASDEAEKTADRLLNEARQTAERLLVKRQADLIQEAAQLNQALTLRIHGEVFVLARQVLKDLADVSLEERMCELFINRLRALSEEDKNDLVKALTASNNPAVVRSAFALPLPQQHALEQAISDIFDTKHAISFDVKPDLINGIELTAHGQTVAWSVTDYLSSLANDIDALIGKKDQ